MRLRNVYRILAAAVCAGAATYLTIASFGQRPQSTPPPVAVPDVAQVPARGPEVKTKAVIVAAKPLQFNNVLTPDVLMEVQWPADSVPPGAFHSREALLGTGKRTVLAALAKGEPILASRVTGPGQRGSLSAAIEEGMEAVSIRVDDVLGVAGFVQPGDRVNVILTYNDRAAEASGRDAASSVIVLNNARVLAIDQIADRGPQAKPAKAVTIEVTAEGAQKVALGARVGQLSLSLLPAGSPSGADYQRIQVDDLGGKQKPGIIRTVPEQKTAPDTRTVTVTRGTERSTYEITDTGRREVKVSNKAVPQPTAQLRPD